MVEVNVLATNITGVSQREVLELLDGLIVSNSCSYVCFCEAHLNLQGMRDPIVRAALDGAAFVFPDGVSMTLGAMFSGEQLPERLTGPMTMLGFMKHGVEKEYRHFLFGGGDGVASQLKTKLEENVPGINIVGCLTPPFREMTDDEILDLRSTLKELKADVVWVALGAPKQELWMAKYVDYLDIPLMLGVGAAFDFHSGNRKWAPAWIRGMGLEWLYRMFTGGRRVFVRNLKFESSFVYYIAKDWAVRQVRKLLPSKN